MKIFGSIFNQFLNYLHKNLLLIIIVYFLVQLFYLLFIPFNYTSDSLYYFQLAQDCLHQHSIYPTPGQIYQDYLIAPLYINLLILLLLIYNSPMMIGILNIILNFTQLLLVFGITKKIFDLEKAKTAVIIYIFYLSTLGLVLLNLTELLFMVMILSGIYFFYKKTFSGIFVSGFLAGLSLAVRPIGWALIAAYLVNYIFTEEKINIRFKELSFLVSAIILAIAIYGYFSYAGSGRFIYTSTNGPVNLLIGANKNATGAYNEKVFEKGNEGYIYHPETMPYYIKQSYWLEKAREYIISHPLQWISVFPMKMVHIFIWDDFSVHKLLSYDQWNTYRVVKYIIKGPGNEKLLGNRSLLIKILFFMLIIFHHIYYFSIIAFFGLTIFKYYKEIFMNNNLRILLLFIVAGITIHFLTFGDARFKYPYIITMMIIISPVISFIKNHKTILNSKNRLIYV